VLIMTHGGDCEEGDKMGIEEKLTPQNVNGWKRPFREFIGTYIFLTLAFGVASCAGSSLLNVAMAFGLGLSLAAFLFKCDANPAVSLAKLLLRRGRQPAAFVINVIAQFIGAILAAVTVNYGFDCDIGLAVATPSVAYGPALVIEMILTFILICAACMQFASGSIASAIGGIMAGLALLACILVGGDLTGAALNPFRALAPSIFSHFPADAWIYYVAPFIASILAALILVLAKEMAPRCQQKRCP